MGGLLWKNIWMMIELPENSDEKRIYKAELRAGWKCKAAEAAKNKARKGTSAKPAFVCYSAERVMVYL